MSLVSRLSRTARGASAGAAEGAGPAGSWYLGSNGLVPRMKPTFTWPPVCKAQEKWVSAMFLTLSVVEQSNGGASQHLQRCLCLCRNIAQSTPAGCHSQVLLCTRGLSCTANLLPAGQGAYTRSIGNCQAARDVRGIWVRLTTP